MLFMLLKDLEDLRGCCDVERVLQCGVDVVFVGGKKDC